MTISHLSPFEARLKQQVGLLRDIEGLYDADLHDHALSLAARVSVIVEMLRSQEGSHFAAQKGLVLSTPINPEGGHSEVAPLVSKTTHVNDSFQIVAQRNLPAFQGQNYQTFNVRLGKWLSQAAFLYDHQNGLSRDRLITLMRNKDGGGHPYALVPSEYIQFAQDAGVISLHVTGPGATGPEPAIHYASMRQISHEISLATGVLIQN